MSSVVNVEYHNVAVGEVVGDGTASDEAYKLDSKWVNGGPYEKILADIASMAIEPGVEGGGIEAAAD